MDDGPGPCAGVDVECGEDLLLQRTASGDDGDGLLASVEGDLADPVELLEHPVADPRFGEHADADGICMKDG